MKKSGGEEEEEEHERHEEKNKKVPVNQKIGRAKRLPSISSNFKLETKGVGREKWITLFGFSLV
jgi:nucleoside-specific outer membrane channel protein Tsx